MGREDIQIHRDMLLTYKDTITTITTAAFYILIKWPPSEPLKRYEERQGERKRGWHLKEEDYMDL